MDIPGASAMRMFSEEHAAALWRYVFRLTGDQTRAEDVVQETLRQAGQHPELVGDIAGSARAWLFTTARNLVIDQSANPALNRMLVGDAMALLSAEHRAVVCRSYYEGWTTEQIAAELQIPEAIVKSRLHDALRALRQMLQQMGVTQ